MARSAYRRHILLLVSLALLFVAALTAAASPTSPLAPPGLQQVTIQPAGHFGGWTAALAMSPAGGNHVYLGQGSGFTVLDVSNKADPRQVGGLPLGAANDLQGIALSNSTAYLTNGDLQRQRTDGYWHSYIVSGGAVMPAYGEALSSEEAWHIVNYLRTLAAR